MIDKYSKETLAQFSGYFSWFDNITTATLLSDGARWNLEQQLTELALNSLEKIFLVHYHNTAIQYCYRDDLEHRAQDYYQQSLQYPVFQDMLLPAIKGKLAYVTQNVIHLQKHSKKLIKSVQLGCGDWHDDHMGALQVTFCDESLCYYKFRSPDGEVLFQRVCDLLRIPYNMPERYLIGDGYAEQAVIRESATDLANFYHHMGRYLALFYLLGAIDLHCTNLIAQQKPVFIDLETLTHANHPFGDWCDHYDLLHTLLLPHISYRAGQHPGIDLSAIGFTGNQAWPDHIFMINDMNSTYPKLSKQTKIMPSADNRPSLAYQDASHYQEALLTGYAQGVATITQHADAITDLLHNDNACFRVLLRPTITYARLVQHANHPKLLADSKMYQRYFQQITASRYAKVLPESIVQHEIHDMMQGNIPRFTARINGTDLITKASTYPNFFNKTAVSGIKDRLEKLTKPHFLLCQKTLITKSLEIAYRNRRLALAK